MSILQGTILSEIEDDLLDKSYRMARKVLETGIGSHLRPFVIYKTFSDEKGIVPLSINLEKDLEDQNEEIIKNLKELCRQKKVSDIYITIEMHRTFDENNLPVNKPEYYVFITHESHLFSNMFASEIIMDENDKLNVGPLFKIDEGIGKIGPFFNILCPLTFHSA